MDITQFVMAYGVEQDRLSPPAADGGKRRRHPLPPGAGSLLRVLHPAVGFFTCSRRRFVV